MWNSWRWAVNKMLARQGHRLTPPVSMHKAEFPFVFVSKSQLSQPFFQSRKEGLYTSNWPQRSVFCHDIFAWKGKTTASVNTARFVSLCERNLIDGNHNFYLVQFLQKSYKLSWLLGFCSILKQESNNIPIFPGWKIVRNEWPICLVSWWAYSSHVFLILINLTLKRFWSKTVTVSLSTAVLPTFSSFVSYFE